MLAKMRDFLHNLTLSKRFALASLLILIAGMVGVGAWVQKQIETGVVHRTGVTTALYVDSFVAPNLQEFSQSNELSPYYAEKLSKLLQDTPMGQQIVSFKVWDTRGTLLYSTDSSLIGMTFPMHEGMLRARLGEVVSTISSLEEDENASLGAVHDKLLETYSPVWLSGTNQIIALAEFYQSTDELDREIGVLQRRSWLVLGMAILFMFLLLSGFVRRASETISRQQSELGRKVQQLTELLAQNNELHHRVQRAAASVALLNEGYLRRIGAELHDGPAQDLGLSLLNLDSLMAQIEVQPGKGLEGVHDALTEIQATLRTALEETRGIAAGLSLPKLTELDLAATIVRAVRAHERRSGSKVDFELSALPEQVTVPLKITVYRLIQEALNNAYLHAGGAGQRVSVHCHQNQLIVEISDDGPGFHPEQVSGQNGRLGLSGMRERVESLGGEFKIDSQIERGTRIRATLPCQKEEEQIV